MFAGVVRLLPPGGVFALYGPFNYGGRYTSGSNARFDAMLRRNDPASALRDFDDIAALVAASLDGFIATPDGGIVRLRYLNPSAGAG